MASSSAATSTPGTTKKVGGHCVVCGKETHLRCEACSRFGTDFMYFCRESNFAGNKGWWGSSTRDFAVYYF
ncbi:hypothetical protein JCM5350_000745 [Sporobolomyces pararoseus]